MSTRVHPAPPRTLLFSAALTGLLVCSGHAFSQNAGTLSPLEPDLGPIATKGAVPASSIAVAIDRAREAGDRPLLAQLEAQRVQPIYPGAESEGNLVRFPSSTRSGPLTPHAERRLGDSQQSRSVSDNCFGADVFVRWYDLDGGEYGHGMCSDSAGVLYCAFVDNDYGYEYIQVYSSVDGGAVWDAYGYVQDPSANLHSPSIAVGKGSGGDALLLAYIRDDGINMAVPEVATKALPSGLWTIQTVPVYSHWEGYDKPVIITDNRIFDTWYAYLTCEGIYSSAANNVNVCSWRSTDLGVTWGNQLVPFGDYDVFEWTDPDICYGTTYTDPFLVTYQVDDLTVYTCQSIDNAVSWNPPVAVGTLPRQPDHPVDPEIATGYYLDNIMVAMTAVFSTNPDDDVRYSYSTDAGATWSTIWTMPGYTGMDEYGVSLSAAELGGSWHVAFTSGSDHSVRYNRRPQDLSDYYGDTVIIDDEGKAGSHDAYVKKGIAANWTSDVATVVWSDARNPSAPMDYSTYADTAGTTGLMLDRRLVSHVDASTVNFTLNAGPAFAGRFYLLLGSLSGTTPGTPLPGGLATIPLNYDQLALWSLTWGPPIFTNFFGILDADGQATAQLNIPAASGIGPGDRMHFAFCIPQTWDFASHAVAVDVTLP